MAHFIRELQAEVEDGDKVWSAEMKELLLSAIEERNTAKKNGTWFSDLRIDQIENSYERLTKKQKDITRPSLHYHKKDKVGA